MASCVGVLRKLVSVSVCVCVCIALKYYVVVNRMVHMFFSFFGLHDVLCEPSLSTVTGRVDHKQHKICQDILHGWRVDFYSGVNGISHMDFIL